MSARRRTSRVAALVVVAITAIWSLPTIGVLVTSFRTDEAAAYAPWWKVVVDHQVSLDSYRQVVTGGDLLPDGIWPYLLNSIVIVVPVMVFGLAIASMAAYGLAWVQVRGAWLLLMLAVALQVVPVQMALLPLLKLFYSGWSIGPVTFVPAFTDSSGRPLLAGTFVPLWFAHTAFLLPLAIYLMHRAMVQVPRALVDAARVDGASHPVIFRRIMLPLTLPTIAALAIFEFLWVWNDLLIASTFVPGGSDYSPVTAYLSYLNGALQQTNLLGAGAFVAIAIPLAVFFAMQRHFARGLVAGAVRE
ncbi:MAG: carbohydrate ABC transporter permease [Candidatus Nanopelagicales bacterium]